MLIEQLQKKKNKLVDVFHRSLTSDYNSPPELPMRLRLEKYCSVIKLTTTPDFSEYICFCNFGTNAPYVCIWPVT